MSELAPYITDPVSDEEAEARARTAVGRHPRRREIEQLLRDHRKTPRWISRWLEDEYPLEITDPEDPTGEALVRHPDYRRHKRLQLSERALERYRERFLPETVAGVDVVSEDVEDLIGRVFPAPVDYPFELDVMATQIRVAEQMLVEQRQADIEMGMGISELSLQASSMIVDHADRRLAAARSLGRPGYEPAVERQAIDLRSRHEGVSIELHGRIGRGGEVLPVESDKVKLMEALLTKDPREVEEMVQRAKAAQAALQGPAQTEVIDGNAT